MLGYSPQKLLNCGQDYSNSRTFWLLLTSLWQNKPALEVIQYALLLEQGKFGLDAQEAFHFACFRHEITKKYPVSISYYERLLKAAMDTAEKHGHGYLDELVEEYCQLKAKGATFPHFSISRYGTVCGVGVNDKPGS